jgi:hypothetical protein
VSLLLACVCSQHLLASKQHFLSTSFSIISSTPSTSIKGNPRAYQQKRQHSACTYTRCILPFTHCTGRIREDCVSILPTRPIHTAAPHIHQPRIYKRTKVRLDLTRPCLRSLGLRHTHRRGPDDRHQHFDSVCTLTKTTLPRHTTDPQEVYPIYLS